jgi:DNA repair exonuclease SbcCD nuclease subunit
MSRLCCSSDWHFSMAEDIDRDLDAAIRQMRSAEECDAFVIAGDIYHQKSEPKSRLRVATLIQNLAELAPVVICKGNHDAPGDIALLARLKSRFPIHAFEEPGEVEINDDCVLTVFPWLQKGYALSVLPVSDLPSEVSDKTVSQLALEYLRHRVSLGRDVKKQIFVGHVMIHGAKLQNNQPFLGQGLAFGQYDLREAGFDAGIFGHVHLRNIFDNGLFFYPGSPVSLNYGETGEKYFAILDTDVMQLEWHRLNGTARVLLQANCSSGAPALDFNPEDIKNSRVRVRYTLEAGEDQAKIRREIEAMLLPHWPLEIKVEAQVRPKQEILGAAVASAQSSATKLEAWWDATAERPDPEVRQDVLAKLEILETERHA